jgi:anaerobic C4-dicarboxylate transporter DcuA
MSFLLQLAVMLAAIAAGARAGGMGRGAWGAVGVAALCFGFGAEPGKPPIDVMLIILAAITAASALEAAGGVDLLVRLAEHVIRSDPRRVTFLAPLSTFAFSLCAGTSHVIYPLLPVIAEVARENGVRPERPLAVSVIASQLAVTASPVSAATAAMLVLLEENGSGIGLISLLSVTVPAALLAVLGAALVQSFLGRELAEDPEYQRRLAEGSIPPPSQGERPPAPRGAAVSAVIFLAGVAVVVLYGALKPVVAQLRGGTAPSMPAVIQMAMFTASAAILLFCRPRVEELPRTHAAQAGAVALVTILGIAWLGDTFLQANREAVVGGMESLARAYPPLFALGLFLASVFLLSQAATVGALMPLGFALGLPAPVLAAMMPAVNGYFVLPNYGTLVAAIQIDRTGTTGIGRWVLNHSFQVPGLVGATLAVLFGLAIVRAWP